MAASEAAKEAIWLTRLYKQDFCIEDISLETKGDLTEKEYLGTKPLTVFEDNVDRGSVSGISLDTKHPPCNCQQGSLLLLGVHFGVSYVWPEAVGMCQHAGLVSTGVLLVTKWVLLLRHLGGICCWCPVWFQLWPPTNRHKWAVKTSGEQPQAARWPA